MLRWTVNDGGRAASLTPDARGDCLTRAIAVTTGVPYDEVAGFVAAILVEHGYAETHDLHDAGTMAPGCALPPGCDKITDYVMLCFGFERCRYAAKPITPTQARDLYGDCVIELYGHAVAIRDGAVQDTWDSRQCQYNEGEEASVIAAWRLG